MKKLTREAAKTLAAKLVRESECCPVCRRTWASIIGEYEEKVASNGVKRRQAPWVLDHDHQSGQCRGVLCRGCNGAEGKVSNIAATWGKQGHDTKKVLAWLIHLVRYLGQPSLPYIYPTHVSKEEQAKKDGDIRKEAARKKAAARRKQMKKVL